MSNKNYIWNGIYNSWPTLIRSDEFYSSEVWLSRANSKLLDYLERRKNNNFVPITSSNLPAVMSDQRIKSILHFGGSSGWQYLYLLDTAYVENLKKYTILETKKTVSYFRENIILSEGVGVFYTDNLEKIETHDLLYANSVLQYFPDLKYFVKIIQKSSPKKILIDDSFVGFFDTFYSLQFAYNFEIPCSFLNANFLIKTIKDLGYQLDFNIPFLSPIQGKIDILPMMNFPLDLRIDYPRSFLFSKI